MKVAELRDNFPGSALDPAKWVAVNGAPTYLSDNQAELPCVATTAEIQSVTVWDLTSSQLAAKVTPPVISVGAAVAMVCQQNPTNHVSFLMQVEAGGTPMLLPRKVVAGVTSDVRIPYDSARHAFWRIREQNGNVTWETSPNGQFWDLQRYEPVGALDLSAVTVRFLCGLV